MALVVESLPSATAFFNFFDENTQITDAEVCCAMNMIPSFIPNFLIENSWVPLTFHTNLITGECYAFPGGQIYPGTDTIVVNCLQVTPDRVVHLPPPIGNGQIIAGPLTWQITSITITVRVGDTPVELVNAATPPSRTVDASTLGPVFTTGNNGLVTEYVDAINSMFAELGADHIGFRANNGPAVTPTPPFAMTHGVINLEGPAIEDWSVTQFTPAQMGGSPTTLIWTKTGNNVNYFDCPVPQTPYVQTNPSKLPECSTTTVVVNNTGTNTTNRSLTSSRSLTMRSQVDPVIRARAAKVNLDSTPLDADYYPLTDFKNASPLLKERVSMIRRALELTYSLGNNDPNLKMWLFGSQVKGTSGSGNPDIDVAFYHPRLGIPGPLLSHEELTRLAKVIELLTFAVDLQFSTEEKPGLEIPLE